MSRRPSLTKVVQKGDLRASLEALRDTLASEIESGVVCKACGGLGVSPTAPLARQLADVLKALDSMKPVERSAVDDLAKRRVARRAEAAVPERAASGDVGRSGGGRAGRDRRPDP